MQSLFPSRDWAGLFYKEQHNNKALKIVQVLPINKKQTILPTKFLDQAGWIISEDQ